MKVGLFGTGAYGMALASILDENNVDITMWTKFEDEKENLVKTRKNEKLIKNFVLSEKIKFTTSISECAKDKDLLVIAIPAAFINDLCLELKECITLNQHICIASKGIEQHTGLFVHEIIKKHINTDYISVISGPSFAKDVVSKKPIGLSLATKSEETKEVVKGAFRNSYVKLRHTDDVVGVEICGAIKNVIALAAGMLDGLGGNNSTSAMLITEAIHDMEEILDAFGATKRTVLSFAGFGDLLLTCTSTDSRNYTYGKLVGSKTSNDILEEYIRSTTVEGYYTLVSIYQLLKDKKVKIPIINLIYNIINKNYDPEELLTFLVEKV